MKIMTQEDKKLLLIDLCTRLPWGVKVAIELSEDKYTKAYDLREIDNDSTAKLRQQVTIWDYGFYRSVISYPLIDCRPYLRPMSSMTEEEKEEYHKLCDNYYGIYFNSVESIDWLNAHHFDYRGLIEKGLALKAPEEMYKQKGE